MEELLNPCHREGEHMIPVRCDFVYFIPYSPIRKHNQKYKRSNSLPSASLKILYEWYWKHAEDPYPDNAEKNALEKKTGLTRTQINNFMSGQRRKVLRQ